MDLITILEPCIFFFFKNIVMAVFPDYFKAFHCQVFLQIHLLRPLSHKLLGITLLMLSIAKHGPGIFVVLRVISWTLRVHLFSIVMASHTLVIWKMNSFFVNVYDYFTVVHDNRCQLIQLKTQQLSGRLMSLCVCVCVYERERERERELTFSTGHPRNVKTFTSTVSQA